MSLFPSFTEIKNARFTVILILTLIFKRLQKTIKVNQYQKFQQISQKIETWSSISNQRS